LDDTFAVKMKVRQRVIFCRFCYRNLIIARFCRQLSTKLYFVVAGKKNNIADQRTEFRTNPIEKNINSEAICCTSKPELEQISNKSTPYISSTDLYIYGSLLLSYNKYAPEQTEST